MYIFLFGISWTIYLARYSARFIIPYSFPVYTREQEGSMKRAACEINHDFILKYFSFCNKSPRVVSMNLDHYSKATLKQLRNKNIIYSYIYIFFSSLKLTTHSQFNRIFIGFITHKQTKKLYLPC